MDREAELQALIRKLGQEASSWLDGGNSETEPILKDQGRLSVGPVRKDLPSQTGTTLRFEINQKNCNTLMKASSVTEVTSIGSCVSSHEDLDYGSSTPDTK